MERSDSGSFGSDGYFRSGELSHLVQRRDDDQRWLEPFRQVPQKNECRLCGCIWVFPPHLCWWDAYARPENPDFAKVHALDAIRAIASGAVLLAER